MNHVLLILIKKRTIMKYLVKNVINNAIVVVDATGRIEALNKGRKIFTEPNRNPQPVTIVG